VDHGARFLQIRPWLRFCFETGRCLVLQDQHSPDDDDGRFREQRLRPNAEPSQYLLDGGRAPVEGREHLWHSEAPSWGVGTDIGGSISPPCTLLRCLWLSKPTTDRVPFGNQASGELEGIPVRVPFGWSVGTFYWTTSSSSLKVVLNASPLDHDVDRAWSRMAGVSHVRGAENLWTIGPARGGSQFPLAPACATCSGPGGTNTLRKRPATKIILLPQEVCQTSLASRGSHTILYRVPASTRRSLQRPRRGTCSPVCQNWRRTLSGQAPMPADTGTRHF